MVKSTRTASNTKSVDFITDHEISEEKEIKNEVMKNKADDAANVSDAPVAASSSSENRAGGYLDLAKKRKMQHSSFLLDINLDAVKDEVMSFVPATPGRTPRPKRPILLKDRQETPLRKSLRLQNKPASENSSTDVSYVQNVEVQPRRRKIRGVVSFSVATKEDTDQFPEQFVKDLQFLKDEKPRPTETKALDKYVSNFKSMKIVPSLVAKLAYSRIYCISVHPSPTKVLFATGSRDGEVSFWDVEERKKKLPLLFVPHTERVPCLQFSPHNFCEVYTCSYDGSMRCGDLIKGVFDEVFRASDDDDGDDVMCTSFDFISPYTYLVSLWHGAVTLVDRRTKSIHGEKDIKTHESVVKTVSVHPTKNDYFVVAGGNGIASVWDLRMNKPKAVTEISHGRSLNSAYFSPITGDYILTTSMDDKLSIFDSSSLKSNIPLKKAIRHNNHTGRWLAPLRAVWLPNCEEGFIVGSMEQPRRIEVYNINGQQIHTFAGESLGSVCSVNAVHPDRPAVAGANSSGKIHVFMP